MRGQSIYRDIPIPKNQSTYYGLSQKAKDIVSQDKRLDKKFRPAMEFCKQCQEEFGEAPFTKADAFHAFSSPYGLDYYQIADLIKDSREYGFLDSARIT